MTLASPDARRRELARIHLLAKELRLARDEYEDVLFALARVRSAGDLNAEGRRAVIEHLAARARAYGEWSFIARAAAERRPLLRKIMVLAGARGKKYVEGISLHMFGIAQLEFCAPDQLHRIVAALAVDAKRRAAKALS